MTWIITADRPIYLQLVEQLELAIVAGEYRAGGKLPSVRELAAEAAVNPNTMQRAMQELEARGLINTQRTAGRTIILPWVDYSLWENGGVCLFNQLFSNGTDRRPPGAERQWKNDAVKACSRVAHCHAGKHPRLWSGTGDGDKKARFLPAGA